MSLINHFKRILKLRKATVSFVLCLSVRLSVVLYGCEAWSLILREEHRLRVFENKMLRILFGPKRAEVTR
jgi:hypothetical protein